MINYNVNRAAKFSTALLLLFIEKPIKRKAIAATAIPN
jgi:hypothetical protein